MKDLDFDELDQAVSSVLSNGSDESKKDEQPVAADTASAPESKPAPASVAPDPVVPVGTKPAPAVSPAVKRRGQFLDMVHPSADMTSKPSMPKATTRTRLAPVSKDLSVETADKKEAPESVEAVEPAKPESKVETKPEATPEPKPAPVLEESGPDEKSDIAWPDPLDLAPQDSDDKTDDTDQKAETMPETDDTPATTPFVTDAKVDKRPLGAFGAVEAAAATTEPLEPVVEKPIVDEQKNPEPTPPELQPDVVSVEAAAEREFTGNDAESHEKPTAHLSESIPQQYKTPAHTPDATPHPVFDTQEYHQPLLPAHGQRKGHGWLVVLIIVLLLVIGAALGYFAFVAGF